MLSDEETFTVVSGPISRESQLKYTLVMRLAERWALAAFKEKTAPDAYCEQKYEAYSECRRWDNVTKTVLCAFVIREWHVINNFLNDKQG